VNALCWYLLRLGAAGFGGPIALVGYMQRDLVERDRTFTPEQFSEALAFAQLAPGPLAAQVAIYLGWLKGKVRGATLAGLAFVLPSFVIVLALSVLYVRFGGLAWIQGAFIGVAAAVIAIMVRSAWKLARLTLRRDPLLWLIGAINGIAVVATGTELVWLILVSGFVLLAARKRIVPAQGTALVVAFPLLLAPIPLGRLGEILWFFTKAGSLVFGSGLAIIPFLYGGVVQEHGWLNDRQFLDAVAVGMITPGPVVITVAFMGYLAAGPMGGTVAALGVFLPVYLTTVLGAPYFARLTGNPGVRAFVEGVTAAATGAIAGAAIVLSERALRGGVALALAVITLGVLLHWKRLPEPAIVLAAGLVGVLAAV
jgi:chromate transporter